MSEREPATWENHDRVGDLDMVELKIAKAPMKQSKMKPLGNFS